ncbi:MAG TPA: PEP-CTERM sorting domain-containing protein [Burkholderiaceae bacterium]|jgi:hypothetical protein
MKKTLILATTAAAAMIAAMPASASTYDYTGTARALFGNSSAAFTMSIDDSTKMLTASVTSTATFAGGFGINCCSLIGSQPALMFTSSSNPAGTYSYTVDLSNLASYDAGFLAANGGTADSAFAALLSGMNTVTNINTGASIASVTAWTSGTANLAGNVIPSPVPEPATYGLMGLGLGLLAWRRRQQNAA